MKLHIHETLIYDPILSLAEQAPEVQEYINNIAFGDNNANQELSVWQGDDTPGQPVRYEKLVHDIPTQEGAVIRTVVGWNYRFPYGDPACFAGTHTIRLEVLNG